MKKVILAVVMAVCLGSVTSFATNNGVGNDCQGNSCGGQGGQGGQGGNANNAVTNTNTLNNTLHNTNTNVNANTNSNRNDNTNVNANTNKQGQIQGQGQLQGQSADNNGNNWSNTNNEPRVAAQAANVQLSVSNLTCGGTAGVGVSTPGLGVSGGFSYEFEHCVMIQDAVTFKALGHNATADQRLCASKANREAFKRSGEVVCKGYDENDKADLGVPASAVKSAPAATTAKVGRS